METRPAGVPPLPVGPSRRPAGFRLGISFVLTDKSLSCPSVKATGSHSGSALEPTPGSPGKDERAQGTNLQTGTQRPPRGLSLPEKILAHCGLGGPPAQTPSRHIHTTPNTQAPRLCQGRLTCMPQTLTPSVADVLCSHFRICRAAFSADASSPCCRVPIFRSSTQGYLKWCTTFSSRRNSGLRSRGVTTYSPAVPARKGQSSFTPKEGTPF